MPDGRAAGTGLDELLEERALVDDKPLDIAQVVTPRFAEKHQRTALQHGELERIDLTLKGENLHRSLPLCLGLCCGRGWLSGRIAGDGLATR